MSGDASRLANPLPRSASAVTVYSSLAAQQCLLQHMKYLSGFFLAVLFMCFLASCARRPGLDTGLDGSRKPGHDCHCGVFHPMG
jgi:hypothetical protein